MLPPPIHSCAEQLTLGLDVSDPIKVHAALLHGLPFSAVTKFEKATQMPRGEVAKLISVAPRTLARRQDEKRLQADESDRLFRLATLFRKAIDLFHGDDESAMRWLRSPRPALGGETPLELAKTDIGVRQVETLIEQVRHGVYV
jgi:putative toxin-antitoxin system antitoxin component (TIGR02293 family)